MADEQITRRHAYRKDQQRDAICTCGQGRGEDVHNMMVWHRPRGVGTSIWYSGPINHVAYRIRTRLGNSACWWPEFSLIDEEDWTRIGNGVGTALVQAKLMCEEHRESREV